MLAKSEILQGRYRIVRQLGHGGMGAVYEAIDERFGEPIALKEIRIESANEKQKILIINAFEREAKSLAKARHEAIPYVRDYFSELDRQFLVMELVEGDDLEKMLENRGQPFPLEDVIHWIDQLLDALDYLHNLNPPIIHRDIKPQNLKLSFRRKIKLLDFGIAKSGDRTSTITNQTFVGATLNYSPIEQLLRVINPTFREFIISKHEEKAKKVLSQNTDVRADIYAVGSTFYHLLTNHLPIEATRRTLDIWEGKIDPLPNPSKLNPEIPQSISDALLKAMEIERENRFSLAVEMQKALQEAVTEEKNRKREEENSQKKEAEKTSSLIKPKHLQIAEEEKSSKEILMRAETERFIPESEIREEAGKEIISPTQPSPTQSSNIPSSDTLPSAENLFTKSSRERIFDTKPTENTSKQEVTGTPYFDTGLFEKKKTVSELVPSTEKEIKTASKNGDAKSFWILPLTALGIVTVSSIGGIFWMNNSNSDTNKSVSNTSISAPPSTPTISPIASPRISPTPVPTPDVLENEKSKPTVEPTISKTPQIQNPVKTPAVKKTPKPKPKPTKNSDCIFTGDC